MMQELINKIEAELKKLEKAAETKKDNKLKEKYDHIQNELNGFHCPISQDLITEPYVLQFRYHNKTYQHTYEKDMIKQSLAINPKDPATNIPLAEGCYELKYDHHYRQRLENFCEKNFASFSSKTPFYAKTPAPPPRKKTPDHLSIVLHNDLERKLEQFCAVTPQEEIDELVRDSLPVYDLWGRSVTTRWCFFWKTTWSPELHEIYSALVHHHVALRDSYNNYKHFQNKNMPERIKKLGELSQAVDHWLDTRAGKSQRTEKIRELHKQVMAEYLRIKIDAAKLMQDKRLSLQQILTQETVPVVVPRQRTVRY